MLNKFRLQLVLRILLLLTTVVQSIIKALEKKEGEGSAQKGMDATEVEPTRSSSPNEADSVHELAKLSEALMGLDGLSGADLSFIQEQMNA